MSSDQNLDAPLHIGCLLFDRMDQMDFTGPFEVLSQLPNTTIHTLAKVAGSVRDARGLLLTAEIPLDHCPPLDVMLVPGGVGQQVLMEDETTLAFLRNAAASAKYVLAVCTGVLTCGAAGLLRGRRATTHWNSFHLLPYFGAVPVDERVVIDGPFITTAGVSAGIDGALRLAGLLRGEDAARRIQLMMQYAPEPPFNSGTPASAPPAIRDAAMQCGRALADARVVIAQRVAHRLGI
jgi:cyclohexyl-isocyanide hydratase